MKILLIGANGQVGRALLESPDFARLGDVVAAARQQATTDGRGAEHADLSQPESLPALLDRLRPEIIVNAAAYTAVDRAEQEEELATLVNGTAVGVLGDWARDHGALLVHYSTDYVFDGSSPQPYPVDAPTGPLGAYGRSKLAGEIALRRSGAQHLLLRTAWVYAPYGHNFLLTMLRLAKERDELRVVSDQHGAPTTAALIAAGTAKALAQWQQASPAEREQLSGTHHLVASGATTWHGFASAIIDKAAELGLLARKPAVTAIGSEAFPTPARRPEHSVLDNRGFQQAFGMILPDWRQGMNDVLAALSATRS
jgi:dTDP-4-dehydrorhamnose reductase